MHQKAISLLIKKEYDKEHAKEFVESIKKTNNDMSKEFQKRFGIPINEYFEKVWNINPQDVIEINYNLKESLEELPLKKILFTNAPYIWTNNIMKYFNISKLFEDVYFYDGSFKKPQKESFERILSKYEPSKTIFVDDELKNILGAKKADLTTAYLSNKKDALVQSNYVIKTLQELKVILTAYSIIDNKSSVNYTTLEGGEKRCDIRKFNVNGMDYVLKIANINDKIAADEINNNMKGYISLIKNNLSFIIPNIIGFDKTDKLKWILMTYEGENLKQKISNSYSYELIHNVIHTLDKIYEISLRKNPDLSQKFIRKTMAKIEHYFKKYLIPYKLLTDNNLERLYKFFKKINMFPEKVSFATLDLTPDNILINNEGNIKFIDPQPLIFGNNLIDLGLLKTSYYHIYKLPNGPFLEKLIDKLVLKWGKKLNLPEDDSRNIFNLGVLRQYSVSARFRYNQNRKGITSQECAERIKEIIYEN